MTGIFTAAEQLTLTAPFWWGLVVLACVALAYINVGRWTWLIVLLACLLVFTFHASSAPAWTRILAWPVFLGPWMLLALPAIRRPLISHSVLEHLRARLPQLSRAELVTLRSGHAWWESGFFAGAPAWRELMAEPAADLSDSERRFVTQNVAALCDAVQPESAETSDDAEMLRRLSEEKFFGLNIPPRYSGPGYSPAAISAVLTSVATRHPALSLTIAAALAPASLLQRFGTDEQKERILPRLAAGPDMATLAVNGIDDLALTGDQARVFTKGDDIWLRLNFSKRYVTLASQATHFIVAVRVEDPDEILLPKGEERLSLIIVQRATTGVTADARHRCLSPGLTNGPVHGNDVEVTVDDVVGGRDGIGHGWHMLSELQITMRALGVPAIASGAAKRIARVTGAHSRVRFQLHELVGALPGAQESLARVGAQTYCLEALRRVTIAACSSGKEPAVIASVAKYQSTERLRAVVTDAVDLYGLKALCGGPSNLLGGYMSLVPLIAHADGTNLVSRNLTIFGHGLIRSHPYVARELEAVRDQDRLRGERRFDELFGKHIAFAASNIVKALVLAVAGGRLARTPPRAGWSAKWFRRLSRMSAAFAATNDILLSIFGGDLKNRQRESARMADILSLLYSATAVLKLHRDQGSKADERAIVEYVMHDCLWQIQRRFDALLSNLPGAWGWILRRIVFPFGRPYRRQPDAIEKEIADSIRVPSGVRHRLTAGVCMPADPQSSLNLLEQAHTRVVDDKPIYRKLQEARAVNLVTGSHMGEWLESARSNKVLSDDELARIAETEALRRKVLSVDDEDAVIDI